MPFLTIQTSNLSPTALLSQLHTHMHTDPQTHTSMYTHSCISLLVYNLQIFQTEFLPFLLVKQCSMCHCRQGTAPREHIHTRVRSVLKHKSNHAFPFQSFTSTWRLPRKHRVLGRGPLVLTHKNLHYIHLLPPYCSPALLNQYKINWRANSKYN